MKLGIISDAHGNSDGLALCLDFLIKNQKVDEIVFLGDAVGYFPDSTEVCRLLQKEKILCLMGNHEAMTLGILPKCDPDNSLVRLPSSSSLPADWLGGVGRIGPKHTLSLGGVRILLAHATPDDPLTGKIQESKDVRRWSEKARVILVGHTHRPFARLDKTGSLILNPGSCGYPRDHGTLLSAATLCLPECRARIWRLPFRFCETVLRQVHRSVRNVVSRKCKTPVGTVARNDIIGD
ncbi:MAG: metallophosphoesterase family protein [Desulfovibrio sp.]|nr:metallophosphoesterase family protein [Desulfovibrio sp.]